MAQISTADEFFLQYLQVNKPHAKSLISTFFGDLALPFGGKAWIETISQLLVPLGINQRLVRTSLFRLCEEDWLYATRFGRKSYYQLTKRARTLTRFTEKKIYYPQSENWDGMWTLLFLVYPLKSKEQKKELEQQLKWLGFGTVAKQVWAHPTLTVEKLSELTEKLGLQENLACMRARNIQNAQLGFKISDKTLAHSCMQLTKIETGYSDFCRAFTPVRDNLSVIVQNSSADALLTLRIVLIDAFRKKILNDPNLPKELLPTDWMKEQAVWMCREIYTAVFEKSNAAYQAKLESIDAFSEQNEATIALSASYLKRFCSK